MDFVESPGGGDEEGGQRKKREARETLGDCSSYPSTVASQPSSLGGVSGRWLGLEKCTGEKGWVKIRGGVTVSEVMCFYQGEAGGFNAYRRKVF